MKHFKFSESTQKMIDEMRARVIGKTVKHIYNNNIYIIKDVRLNSFRDTWELHLINDTEELDGDVYWEFVEVLN